MVILSKIPRKSTGERKVRDDADSNEHFVYDDHWGRKCPLKSVRERKVPDDVMK